MKGERFDNLPMDVSTLLAMTPEEVAQAIIARRHDLAEALPEIVRERKKELDYLNPLVDGTLKERDLATNNVQNLKQNRDSSRIEAKELREKLGILREKLIEEKRLKNPNPSWAKEKLASKLADLDEKLETSALDINAERKLIREMRELTRSHEEWVTNRIESDPELKEYQDGWKRHRELLAAADAAHDELVELAKVSEEQHKKYEEHRDVQKIAQAQYNRAKALQSSANDIVSYWNHRIENGFGDLKDGTGDLLAAARIVSDGKPSSMPRLPPKENSGGEEE
ncbi:MAG: hypothetical protein CMA77_05630 [Euryarchaeota archaeon]|nr:hypothetical protein [Euryarchaeota archaeon]